MFDGTEITVFDHADLIDSLLLVFGNRELANLIRDAIEKYQINDQPKEMVDIYDVEGFVDHMLAVCSMFYNNNYLELDHELADIFKPGIDLEQQKKLEKTWIERGYKTYILGDDVIAYLTEMHTSDFNEPYKLWHIIKHESNGEPIEALIYDHYSKK